MKNFLVKILLFFSLLVSTELLIICLPTPVSLKKSLYFSKLDKDSLLQAVNEPRIIFIGGSNLSFGLNGQLLKDSLKMNPINTGIHANLGIIFMMDEVSKYIQKGDIVILVPEYENFYGNTAWGGSGYELLVTTLEVTHRYLQLRPKQLISTFKYFSQYTRAKINPRNYMTLSDPNDIYSRSSFNNFGDAKNHWSMGRVPGSYASTDFGTTFNTELISEISQFKLRTEKKGAALLFSFPCTQETNSETAKKDIKEVEDHIRRTGINVLGTPRTYMYSDSLMFNSTYHLTKKGAELRTIQLIKELRIFLNETRVHSLPPRNRTE